MKRRPDRAAELARQGIAQAFREVAEAGGVVLFGRDGKAFAFYPGIVTPHANDPGAPKRLRELVERRLEQVA